MCGLVAIVNVNGSPVEPELLKNMASRISHRGPDDEGEWCQGNIGFYHKRLSIIDIEAGAQPMSRDGVTVVFNGEIYNYLELRADLTRRGHVFTTNSDTEVLIVAYLEHGSDCVRLLNGIFAFVIYDSRNDQVMAARDHFGVKPLYRVVTSTYVLYASEIKALLVHPDVFAEMDPGSLNEYVTFQHSLGERTMFAGIEKLQPGHSEVFKKHDVNSLRKCRYWKPDYSPDLALTEEDAIDTLRQLLRESIRLQMRSDVPLGAYLSGGLDSSTVAILANDESSSPLETFTGAFREGPEFDESSYAAEVGNMIGSRQHLTYPTEQDFVDSLQFLSYSMDEPAAGPGLFPQYAVSSLAAEKVKVCLGGQGGDEIYGGYARYAITYLEHALKQSVMGDSLGHDDGILIEDLISSLPMLRQYIPMMKKHFSNGFFDSPENRYFALLDRSGGNLSVYSQDFQANYDGEAIFEDFSRVFREPDTSSLINRMTYFDMVSSLPALLQVEDRVSMAVSLESRVPLLDPNVMDFVARVPAKLKWKHGEMKYLFKQAIRDWLPKSVFERQDKMGFPVPLHLWAKGGAKDFVCDILLSSTCRARGLFDHKEVERLISEEVAFGRGLWGLLQIELWHRNFIDQDYHVTPGDQHAAVI